MNWLDTLLGGPPPEKTRSVEALSWLAAGTVLVALILFALQQALRLPAHFGVEDWLGWHQADTLEAAACFWGKGLSRLPAAAAYLLIDTAVFMPLYGLTLLWTTRQVRALMGGQPAMRWLIDGLYALAVLSLLLLWCADALENLGGLARLGMGLLGGLAALAVAAAVFLTLRRWVADPRTGSGWPALLAAAAALGLACAASLWLAPAAPSQDDLAWIATSSLFDGWAHTAKVWLTRAALLLPLGLWLCWWFGLDLDANPAPRLGTEAAAEIRSAYRQTAMGVIGRSRYVLAVLLLFAAFTLMLDQCRDVLLALALPDDGAGVWWWLAMGAGALGLAMLSHACWLWARLVGRIKRSGYEVLALDGVGAWAGEWARTWARLLMLAPLLMSAVLIANVAGDAIIAASVRPMPWELFAALARLAGFTALLVLLAWWLMRQRRLRALPKPADYYNSVHDLRPLLHDASYLQPPLTVMPGEAAAPPSVPAGGATTPQRSVGRAIAWLARPVWQPLLALALLVVGRACMLLMPETTAAAPPALAVLALSLVWWLGPLGLIAMSEQRAVFPWALLLLIVAGVMGLFSDNHTLPALVIENQAELQVRAVLARLNYVALSALLLLAAASAALWLVLVLRPRRLLIGLRRAAPGRRRLMAQARRGQPAAQRWHRRLDRLGLMGRLPDRRLHLVADGWRVVCSAAVIGLLCAGLAGMDRWAGQIGRTTTTATTARPMQAPADAPKPAAGQPLLLVASEGGGVRAAYWTARVLAGLQDKDPGWTSRIVAMSGVSGGSMGFAVWRACARSAPAQRQTMVDCVQRGFGRLDSLSPLLGGLLFEDVWMRLLPTDGLCRPDSGCGMRSRALAFEREWMRAFPRLAERLGEARQGEPALLLNSTVVESGNRAVLGTLRFKTGELPGAEDLIASGRLAASPALVTAAHASARFPFTNPLASLPRAASSPLAAAHLVDGGYHDNSGTASLADLLTRLRKDEATRDRPVQLVLIRNGQLRSGCLPQALARNGGEPPPDCLESESDARELLPPLDVQRLRLYADLLGPALTALNTLGTGAHGREAAAALTARVLPAGTEPPADLGCTAHAPICLLDQMQDASLVPLGWTLSPAARAAMDVRADALVARLNPATK